MTSIAMSFESEQSLKPPDSYAMRTVLEGHWSSLTDVIGLTGEYDGMVCSTSLDKTIRVWLDPKKSEVTFHPELILRGHSLPVTCVLQLRDGRLCTGSKDCLIKIWDPAKNCTSGYCDTTMRGHRKGVNTLCQLTNPHQICSAGDDLTILVWDLQISRYICLLEGHNGPVLDMIELRNGNLCSASADHTLIVWRKLSVGNVANVTPPSPTRPPSSTAGASASSIKMRMSAAQQLLERASAVQGDLYRLENTLITRGHAGAVHCVVELADGRLCSCGADKVLRFWDPVRYVCDMTMQGHWAAVNWVVQLRSGLLCSCSDDQQIKLWHLHQFAKKNISTPDDHCVRTLMGHTSAIRKVRELRDGSLVSCSDDNKVVLWSPV